VVAAAYLVIRCDGGCGAEASTPFAARTHREVRAHNRRAGWRWSPTEGDQCPNYPHCTLGVKPEEGQGVNRNSPMLRRPAPQDSATRYDNTVHGAPAVWRGELAAACRDASVYDRPDVRSTKAAHVIVFRHTDPRPAVFSTEGLWTAACNTDVLLNEDLVLAAHELGPGARCRRPACRALFAAADRQHGDLRHIRAYYRLEERRGIRVGLGMRVRYGGRPGTVVDTSGQYLIVRLDGVAFPVPCHATSGMEYETADGWVSALPAPDPYAGAVASHE
jgi:hypothetical protein